jgi:FkbM family methyltransferase
MLAFAADEVTGRSLEIYGEWAEHELQCLRPYVRPGSVAVDVGANIGTHALAFSRWVGSGSVLAIEAQPVVSALLRVNSLLNKRGNIDVITALCARRRGWTSIEVDYRDADNFGGLSFTELARADGARWWQRRHRKARNLVPIVPLDELAAGLPVSLIKLDIEGMEYDALRGARGLLRRQRPVVYLEQLSTIDLRKVYDYLSHLGYRLYWLETHPFNQNNYRRTAENIWWRTETGILAVRREAPLRGDLVEVRRSDTAVPAKLDARQGIFVDSKNGR